MTLGINIQITLIMVRVRIGILVARKNPNELLRSNSSRQFD